MTIEPTGHEAVSEPAVDMRSPQGRFALGQNCSRPRAAVLPSARAYREDEDGAADVRIPRATDRLRARSR